MKRLIRFCTLLLAAALILGLFTPAFAAQGYKYVALRTGRWSGTLKAPSDTMTIYKLTLSKDSAVTIQWKNNAGGLGVEVFDKKACLDGLYGIYTYDGQGNQRASGDDYWVLAKGTYYVRMYDYDGKAKVKISVKACKDRANYCLAEAYALRSGVVETIAAPVGKAYSRWYRFKLTKAKAITVYVDKNIGSTTTPVVLDSNFCGVWMQVEGNRIDNSAGAYGAAIYHSAQELSPGTYYITIGESAAASQYVTLKWK